jgi:outer membrane protein
MLRGVSIAVAAFAGTVSMSANAGDFSQWEVRGRFVRLDAKGESDAIPALGLPGNAVNVHSVSLPEVDLSYFFTKSISAELILTYPQKMHVSVDAANVGDIGFVDALPPTLTAQYHVLPALGVDGKGFDPYVGAGLNFTWLTDVHLVVPGAPQLGLDTSKTSVGPALQLGFDYALGRNWVLNADLKYAWISYDLKSNGTKVSTLTVDPWLFGFGVGYKF